VDARRKDDVTQQRRSTATGFIRPPSPNSAAHRAGQPLSPRPRAAVASRNEPLVRPRLPVRPASRARAPLPAARVTGRGGRGAPWGIVIAGLLLAILVAGARMVGRLGGGSATKGQQTVSAPHTAGAPVVDAGYLATWQTKLAATVAQQGPPSYAVVALDLNTGATLTADADTPYRAASVNKLELALDVYQRAQKGLLNLDSTVVINDADIQHYGTGTIQLSPAPQTLTYRQLVKVMIEESDNTAAFVIGDRIGLGNMQSDVQGWGLAHTSLADNTTTARDTATLLQKLAGHTLLTAAASSELIGYLEDTAWSDRVQSGVPEGVLVAHKIGTDVDVFNDAAIVFNGSHPYVLTVLGSGAGADDGLHAITAISQQVWQFEQGLPTVTQAATH
jgi:beta-lactamase class A